MGDGETGASQECASGRCLCGRISYTAAVPVMTAGCHCRTCQRQTGTAFSALAAVPAASLIVTGQPACYETRGDSGGLVRRHFCETCGSPLYSIVEATPELVWLKAGTMTGGPPPPTLHMWWDAAVSWLADAFPDAARFAASPPSSR